MPFALDAAGARFVASFLRLLCLFLLLVLSGAAQAEAADAPSESKVKATFLYKFTSYVEWPPAAFGQADAPLVIGVYENDDVAAELTRLAAGRKVNNHSVQTRRLSGTDSAAGCHVLFVGSAASARVTRILADTRVQPVLTVTELDDAIAFASVINFIVIDDQVRFDVSLPAAERSGLKISSRLLAVAHQVVTAP